MDTMPPYLEGVRGIKVTHKGEEMDSGTEAAAIRWLESKGDILRYHPRFSGDGGRYECDAYATNPLSGKVGVYWEVKPHKGDDWLTDPANRAEIEGWQRRMAIIRESEPAAVLAILPFDTRWLDNEDVIIPRQWLLNITGRWWLIDEVRKTSERW